MMRTTAAVVREMGAGFSVETLAIEPPRAGEALVRIAGVGLCHTDLAFCDGSRPYPLPAVLGHEGAGVVEAIGPGVSEVAIGDEVVIGFSACGHCARCDEALPSYCREFLPLNFSGARGDGSTALSDDRSPVASHFFGQSSFAAHAVVRVANLVKVPRSDVPLELLGTLGCGFQTGAGAVMRSMACEAGSSIAIFGGGPVGLAAVMAAAIRHCAAIVLVEPVPARRDLARELGATHVIDPAAGDVVAAIRAVLPDGVDYAFDTSGRLDAIAAARGALANRGMLGLVGVPAEADASFAVNVAELMTFGHRIVGILEGDSDQHSFIPELLAHHAAGRFPFDRLIRTFPLADINAAVAAQARGECVKAVLVP